MTTPAITSFSGDYRWLSNFHLCPVKYEGDIYPSSEHAYQAAKVGRMARAPFMQPGLSCADAKRMGRVVTPRSDWDVARLYIMEAILLDKFTRNTAIAKRLIDTGDAELVEGNHWRDFYWGVCNGTGQNNLGKLLMDLRTRLWHLGQRLDDGNTRCA